MRHLHIISFIVLIGLFSACSDNQSVIEEEEQKETVKKKVKQIIYKVYEADEGVDSIENSPLRYGPHAFSFGYIERRFKLDQLFPLPSKKNRGCLAITYDYDKEGKITKRSRSEEDELEYVYHYNSEGLLDSIVDIPFNFSTEKYTYDNQGRVLSIKFNFPVGIRHGGEVYELLREYTSDTSFTEKGITYYPDETFNNHTAKGTCSGSQDKTLVVTDMIGKEKSYVFNYDENSRLIAIKNINSDYDSIVYEYTETGEVASIEYQGELTQFDYTYNEQGDWITCLRKISGEPTDVTFRTISYY